MKKILSAALALLMCLGLSVPAFASSGDVAYASTQNVEVDGKLVQFQMYALKDANGGLTNYVKLRDVAYVLNGSPASFDVSYNEKDHTIRLWTGVNYHSQNGTEMNAPFSGDRPYKAVSTTLYVDQGEHKLDTIVLTDDQGGGHTYFKLRDLGGALGFSVDWTRERGVIVATGAQTVIAVPGMADELLKLINQERAKAGLEPLRTYDTLTQAANIRAGELITYYGHTRPDGTQYHTVLDETGASRNISASGENIAHGTARTASRIMELWMNSPGHRANILKPEFTHVGVSCVYFFQDPYHYYWVQDFTAVKDEVPVNPSDASTH